MKYLTKNWYKNKEKYHFPCELEIIKINKDDKEKIFLEEYKKTFCKMKQKHLIEEEWVFDDIFKSYLRNVKHFFSAQTLSKIYDIRLLALGKVFQEEYQLVEEEIIKKDVMQAYNKYYNTIKSKLPKDIDERLHLHDCLITNIIKESHKLTIELDCTEGYGDIKKVIFSNYSIQKEDINFINRWWLYEEIYIIDNQYELHIMTSGSREGVAYLTIRADEIILE